MLRPQAHRRLATSMEVSSAAMIKASAASKQATASYLGSPMGRGDIAAGIGARSRIGDFQNAMLRLGGVRGETRAEIDARRSFERGDRQFLDDAPIFPESIYTAWGTTSAKCQKSSTRKKRRSSSCSAQRACCAEKCECS